MPVIGHVIDEFLRTSETFVYTQLRHQSRYGARVYTTRRVNPEQFPFEPVEELCPRREQRYVAATRRRLLRWFGVPTPFQRRLARVVAAESCDVLHAHFGWSGREAVLAARTTGVPLFTAFHGKDVYRPGFGRRIDEGFYSRLFDVGRRFSCVGPNARDHLVGLGCPRDRVEIVKVGVDLDEFPFAPPSADGPLVFTQVARLTEKKGVDLTLRSFAAARNELPNAELWIIGDGPLRESLGAMAHALGVGRSVRFLGRKSHGDVRALLARSHVGVQPSRVAPDGDREGSPTVLIEMQALGLPVAATIHADIPSIVAFPDDLAPEDDVEALTRLLVRLARMSPEERRVRAEAGRALIEREHDASRIASQLDAIYDDLIALKDE